MYCLLTGRPPFRAKSLVEMLEKHRTAAPEPLGRHAADVPAELEQIRQEILSKRDPGKPRISVCAGAGCLATGASKVIAAFDAEIEKQGLKGEVHVKGTGCPGFCERGPVVVVDPEEIDRTDILRATLEAMRRAVAALRVRPDFVLVDALNIPAIGIAQRGLVRGDRISASIAAASIVAKFYRDEMMLAFHDLYPAYGFVRHKGYGTREHLEALRRFGPSPWHRSTFRGVRQDPPEGLPFGATARAVN